MNENINQLIFQNLKDFYFSFKNGNETTYFENDFIQSINSSWPNFSFVNDENKNLLKALKSVKKELIVSKNWIFDEEYVKNNKKTIKNEKFFPLKSWEGMFLNLTKKKIVKPIEDYKVELVTADEIADFNKIVNSSIFHKNVISDQLSQQLNKENFYFYVGKFKDKIVSTCLIHNNGVTSGLYFIATKEILRGKGFAKNIVQYALNHQMNLGNHLFVLHATKMGNKIYSSIGFKAFRKLIIFVKI